MVETNAILCGDALDVLQTLPDECVNMAVTSPPYYGLRNYGMDAQIGLEPTPGEYVSRLTAVFREVRRVLAKDGVLFLNIADSYAGSGKGASANTEQKSKQRYLFTPDNPGRMASRRVLESAHDSSADGSADQPAANMPTTWDGIKCKDMIGIPWALAFALRADGWYLRSDIIWQKINALPHSVKDRPVSSYEHIFLLAKSKTYYFDYKALEEPTLESSKRRYERGFLTNKYAEGAPGQTAQTINKPKGRDAPISDMRRGRDVWSFPTSPLRGVEHYAAYPIELARRCILAGCPEDGIVLDPFFGSGTTGAAALMLGRRYIGVELNPKYIPLARDRIEKYKPADTPRETDDKSARGAFSVSGGD